jgi:hypothetical protein
MSRARSLQRRGVVGGILVLCGFSTWLSTAQTSVAPRPVSAHAVKAAFLIRFGEYVEWPEALASAPAAVIVVVGAPAVARELARIAPGRTIHGKRIVVEEARDDLPKLDGDEYILYVGENARPDVRRALSRRIARHSPMLVVADDNVALQDRAIIRFVMRDQHVRFEVALEPARAAGLKLSSRLLSVAEEVSGADSLKSDDAPAR